MSFMNVNSLRLLGGTQYADVNNATAFNFDKSDSFSIGCWIYTTTPGNTMLFVSKTLSGGDFTGYAFYLQNGRLRVSLVGRIGRLIIIEGTTSITASNWHQALLTYSGTGTAAGLTLTLNGNNEPFTVISDSLGAFNITNAANFQISGRNGANLVFNGFVDYVGVSNVAWNTTQKTAIWNGGTLTDWRNISGISLLGLWPIESSNGDVIDGTLGDNAGNRLNDQIGSNYLTPSSTMIAADLSTFVP